VNLKEEAIMRACVCVCVCVYELDSSAAEEGPGGGADFFTNCETLNSQQEPCCLELVKYVAVSLSVAYFKFQTHSPNAT
jgi:hypothetical protein